MGDLLAIWSVLRWSMFLTWLCLWAKAWQARLTRRRTMRIPQTWEAGYIEHPDAQEPHAAHAADVSLPPPDAVSTRRGIAGLNPAPAVYQSISTQPPHRPCGAAKQATEPVMDSAEPPRRQPGDHPPVPDVADPWASTVAAAQAYQRWGWPVTARGDQVCLDLDSDPGRAAVAVVIPAGLADQVAEVLAGRRCAPAMLAHPTLDSHQVIVAGERFGVPLSWPPGVHRIVTGTLLLPPTPTAHGPVRWVRPPGPLALKLCREVDVRAALSTVLQRLPAGESGSGLSLCPPPHGCRGRIPGVRPGRSSHPW
ncbi:MAG: hypothetical protein ACRDRV_11465 [Pseudonocardiaceae bacterium]